MLVRYSEMTDENKKQLSEIVGKITVGLSEGRSMIEIADQVRLHPLELYHNVYEQLFLLRNAVGRWRYFKILFMK